MQSFWYYHTAVQSLSEPLGCSQSPAVPDRAATNQTLAAERGTGRPPRSHPLLSSPLLSARTATQPLVSAALFCLGGGNLRPFVARPGRAASCRAGDEAWRRAPPSFVVSVASRGTGKLITPASRRQYPQARGQGHSRPSRPGWTARPCARWFSHMRDRGPG